MGVVGAQSDTESNHAGVRAFLAVEDERVVSATGATTDELSSLVGYKFYAIQRSPIGCANMGDVLIIFEMEGLFDELATGSRASQP